MAQLVVLGLTRLQLSEALQLQLAHPALSPVLNPGYPTRRGHWSRHAALSAQAFATVKAVFDMFFSVSTGFF